LDRLLRHRPGDEQAAARAALSAACEIPLTIHAGLFTGRAGLIHAREALGGAAGLAESRRRLLWHASFHKGDLGFRGDQLLRLSMDLATGSAGILLALPGATLPLVTSADSPVRRTAADHAALTAQRR